MSMPPSSSGILGLGAVNQSMVAQAAAAAAAAAANASGVPLSSSSSSMSSQLPGAPNLLAMVPLQQGMNIATPNPVPLNSQSSLSESQLRDIKHRTNALDLSIIDWNSISEADRSSLHSKYGGPGPDRSEFIRDIAVGRVRGVILSSESSSSGSGNNAPAHTDRTPINEQPEVQIITLPIVPQDNHEEGRLTVKEVIAAINTEKKRISWFMGSKLNKQLTKLVKKCSNTRKSYYTLLQRRGRNLPIKLCPCKRCGLPLAAHHVAPVLLYIAVGLTRDI